MLVGKKARLDGSTIVARDEDYDQGFNEKRFVYYPAKNYDELFVSKGNGVEIPLKGEGCGFTAVRDAVEDYGRFDEQGINSYNVAMSATESEASNRRVLGHDPFVKNGIGEDSMLYLVLPFIKTAREGVERLGRLVEQYGSSESNGIAFGDENEIWYMEIVTGHHWVAQRIPDDCYAATGNRVAIQQVNFDDPDNFMWSEGIQEFVEKHHLNPDHEGWNFRHIFGTNTQFDHHYNTPRVWFVQRYFNPVAAANQTPESSEMPFIRKPERKIAVEDIQYILKSHYNETKYDPLGDGNEHDRKVYRAISLSRTAQSHILQMRNSVDSKHAAVQWIEMGVPSFNAYVPFFANADDTDVSYRELPKKMDLKSAFWLNEALAMVVEAHYSEFNQADLDFQKELGEWCRRKIHEVDEHAKKLAGKQLTTYLTGQNHEIASHCNAKAKELLFDLMTQGTELSKLTFKMDPNL